MLCRHRFKQVIEHTEHNPLRLIEIKQAAAPKDRERDEMHVPSVVKASSLIAHEERLWKNLGQNASIKGQRSGVPIYFPDASCRPRLQATWATLRFDVVGEAARETSRYYLDVVDAN